MPRFKPHQQHIRQYFDSLALTYPGRYSPQYPYLQYWFGERLRWALHGKSFQGKRMIDIGAGNGALYNILLQKFTSFDYTATDLSAAMLAQSNIPVAQQWVGEIENWPASAVQFDYIFMLGLVSYLTAEDLEVHLRWAQQHLYPTGELCISFTNRSSWDFQLRRIMRPMMRFFPGTGVVQQTFPILAHTLKEVEDLCLQQGFRMVKAVFLAPSLPFLHYFSAAWAAKLGVWLNVHVERTAWRRRLCPDFLVHLVLK